MTTVYIVAMNCDVHVENWPLGTAVLDLGYRGLYDGDKFAFWRRVPTEPYVSIGKGRLDASPDVQWVDHDTGWP